MAHGKVGFGKDEMLSYKQKHNSAVHMLELLDANNSLIYTQSVSSGVTTTFNYSFIAAMNGAYTVKIYRTGNNSASCIYYIDDVLVTHQEDVNQQICMDYADYKWSFQGGLKTNEIYGNDNYVELGERGADVRTARLNWRIDPLFKNYPFYSPYAFSGNRVIDAFDLDGLQPVRQPQGRQGIDYFPVTEGTAKSLQKQVDAGKPLISRPFECPDGNCIGFKFFLLRPKLNVTTSTTINPATPPVGGVPNVTNISAQINFNPDQATFAAGAVGQIANIAAQAQPTTATVPIGDPTTVRTVTTSLNSENLKTTVFTDVTTQQVQTTTTTSVITVGFSTVLPNNAANAALITQRFNAISNQLQAQGIPAANIVQGATNFGVVGLPNNNQVNFTVATTTATGIGTQTTTTTETATQTFEEDE